MRTRPQKLYTTTRTTGTGTPNRTSAASRTTSRMPDLTAGNCHGIIHPGLSDDQRVILDRKLGLHTDIGSSRHRAVAEDKTMCTGCPVVADCLAWAMENREQGVWGNTTDDERALIRRRANRKRQIDGVSA